MDLNDLELDNLMKGYKVDLIKAIELFHESKIIRIDPEYNLILIYYGGHGIHIYNFEGELRYFYNTGSFEFDNISESEVIKSMEKRIEEKDYIVYEV
jgi:hypothetical protein